MVSVLTTYIVLRTTFVPVMHLSFFADDFAFLNWASGFETTTWLTGFMEPGHFHNITYRALAAVIYLVYLTGSATLYYFLLASQFAINVLILFCHYRRLSNIAIVGLSVTIFVASSIYFDAAHKVYNLITQASAICFLTALHYFLPSGDSSPMAPTKRFLALSFMRVPIDL